MLSVGDIRNWCEQNQFKYEIGKEWCDCVDYTDYVNIYFTGYHLTIYHHTNEIYSCTLYDKRNAIASLVNFDSVSDIQEFLGEYGVL